jgi:hypothetical protein
VRVGLERREIIKFPTLPETSAPCAMAPQLHSQKPFLFVAM